MTRRLEVDPTREGVRMILHPAAWVVLVVGAVIIVWFTMQDDEPRE